MAEQVRVPESKKPLTAKLLSGGLAATMEQRLEEERTIVIRMIAGQRPEVTLTGFWNGKFIRAAMDSIAKAYRLRRHKPSRSIEVEAKGGKGDVRST